MANTQLSTNLPEGTTGGGGKTFNASTVDELATSYLAVQQDVGFQVVQRPAGAGWLRLAVVMATIACLIAVVVNRRLPT